MATSSLEIVFALFPKLTQLDFTGPFEVLRRVPGAKLHVASRAGGSITSDSGLVFANVERLADIPRCDLICVPGGAEVGGALGDAEYLAEVRRLARGARYVTSVCTGSLILAAAGLLEGKRAACHWAWRDLLAQSGAIADPGRVVRDGAVMTGGGVTAGIDFALSVVAEVAGEDVARAIQLSIEYDPRPPFSSGTPEQAPAHVLASVRERIALMYPERKAAMQAALEAMGKP